MKTFALFLSVLLISCVLSAQNQKANHSEILPFNSEIEPVSDTIPLLQIFGTDEPMNLQLKYDITSFIRNKMKGEYLDAELVVDYNGYSATKNIRLKARGNNRKKVCFFPPIYLNFKTDPIKNSELKGFRKIKMVTHCSTSKSYSVYLLREFLVYKLYNVLSDNSFRVKLLNIDYTDTGKKGRHYKRHGILLEPIELLVKRTESVEVDGANVQGVNVSDYEADVVALFQYMIGNTDWRIKSGHNTKFIKPLGQLTQKVIPVPYDFDYAGFVGTNYAEPQEWTSIKDVREREYLGYCRNNDEAYLKVIDLFMQKRDEIIKTISSFTYLSEKERSHLVKYIESFYKELEKPNYILSVVNRECRSIDF